MALDWFFLGKMVNIEADYQLLRAWAERGGVSWTVFRGMNRETYWRLFGRVLWQENLYV